MKKSEAVKFFEANETPYLPHMLVSLPAVVEMHDGQFYPVLCYFTDFEEKDIVESAIIWRDSEVSILKDDEFKDFIRLENADENTVYTDIVCRDNVRHLMPPILCELFGWAWNELVERHMVGIDNIDQDEARHSLVERLCSVEKCEELLPFLMRSHILETYE